MKELIGVISVLLVFVSYATYIRDTISGKTTPHIYSWFLWSLLNFIIFALQLKGGGGIGAYVTLAMAVLMAVVFLLGLRNGKKNVTLFDTVFLIVALLAMGIWVFIDQPVVSIILLCTIDMISFVPTIRKSWNKPHEETLFSWSLNGFRHGLSIFALQNYNIKLGEAFTYCGHTSIPNCPSPSGPPSCKSLTKAIVEAYCPAMRLVSSSTEGSFG